MAVARGTAAEEADHGIAERVLIKTEKDRQSAAHCTPANSVVSVILDCFAELGGFHSMHSILTFICAGFM
jgi:hypothetical protein